MFNESLYLKITKAKPLSRAFYKRKVVKVAIDLLGKILVRKYNNKILSGKIVEVEAYNGVTDPASHAYKGMTPRNKVMWDHPGKVYVYTIYGIHYCLNLIAEPKGIPAAVLIRALQPIIGIEEMIKNRGVNDLTKLTNGPAKLTQALKITKELNGIDATVKDALYVVNPPSKENIEIVSSKRIGITKGTNKLWRFYIKNNPFVSKK